MPTPLEICTDIIVNHEKQTFAEVSTDFKGTVLEAVSRATRYLYHYADWSFRVAYLEDFLYGADPGYTNSLPDDFLSINQTGAVFLKESSGGRVLREIIYRPLPEIVRKIKGPSQTTTGQPSVFSLGGPMNGLTNQREIFLYPKPSVDWYLDLVYQAACPGPFVIAASGEENSWEDPIRRIPVSWHYVIREMAIVFRLIDKEGDSSRYQELLKTCMKTMLEQEPHGRESTHVSLSKKLWWRMRGR